LYAHPFSLFLPLYRPVGGGITLRAFTFFFGIHGFRARAYI
jgi:hypothetical protein